MSLNTLWPRLSERHLADDIFKCIFLNENVWIPIKFSLKYVPKGPINHIPALVQIMAWCRPGDKPLSEPMMVSLPLQICVTRPKWAKACIWFCRACFAFCYGCSIISSGNQCDYFTKSHILQGCKSGTENCRFTLKIQLKLTNIETRLSRDICHARC